MRNLTGSIVLPAFQPFAQSQPASIALAPMLLMEALLGLALPTRVLPITRATLTQPPHVLPAENGISAPRAALVSQAAWEHQCLIPNVLLKLATLSRIALMEPLPPYTRWCTLLPTHLTALLFYLI